MTFDATTQNGHFAAHRFLSNMKHIILDKEEWEKQYHLNQAKVQADLGRIEEYILPHTFGHREFKRDYQGTHREIHIHQGNFRIFFSVEVHRMWKNFRRSEDIVYNCRFSSLYENSEEEIYLVKCTDIFICTPIEILEPEMPSIMLFFEKWRNTEAMKIPNVFGPARQEQEGWVNEGVDRFHNIFLFAAEQSYFDFKNLNDD